MQELELTRQLTDGLQPFNVFDTEEGMAHRLVVLGKLNDMVQKWVYDISIAKVGRSGLADASCCFVSLPLSGPLRPPPMPSIANVCRHLALLRPGRVKKIVCL